MYLLPEFSLGFSGEEGSGRFLFRFKPLSPGIIFQASFRNKNTSTEGLRMSLVNRKDSCFLILESGGLSSEIPIAKESYSGEFMPVILDFGIRNHLFTANLYAGDRSGSTDIFLSESLSGEGSLQFGAPQAAGAGDVEIVSTDNGTVPDTAGTVFGDAVGAAAEALTATAIIDEFAIINSSGSRLSGVPAQENSADGKKAAHENPGSS
jgi:hypothetical protein